MQGKPKERKESSETVTECMERKPTGKRNGNWCLGRLRLRREMGLEVNWLNFGGQSGGREKGNVPEWTRRLELGSRKGNDERKGTRCRREDPGEAPGILHGHNWHTIHSCVISGKASLFGELI